MELVVCPVDDSDSGIASVVLPYIGEEYALSIPPVTVAFILNPYIVFGFRDDNSSTVYRAGKLIVFASAKFVQSEPEQD